MFKRSLVTGLSFGLTSGIITTLGLIVGLDAGTHSKTAVLGGVLTIAIADAFSDALGMHVSQESQRKHSFREIWEATLATFIAKFCIAMTFVVPITLLSAKYAVPTSIGWGLTLLAVYSFILARKRNEKPLEAISEHAGIAIIVIILTHYVGDWIGTVFQ